MPLKFNNNLSNIEDRVPSGLRNLDVRRKKRRDEKNFSLKIQKLYGIIDYSYSSSPLPEYYDEDDFQNRSSGEFNLSITNFSDTYYDIVTDFQNEAAGDYNTNITTIIVDP